MKLMHLSNKYKRTITKALQICSSLCLASSIALFAPTSIASLGDLAPRGNTDGVLNAADYLVLQRIILGDLIATPNESLNGDVAPLHAPDGILNAADLVVLLRAIKGEVVLNQTPSADAGGPYSGVVGSLIGFDGAASSDPDGDTLTFTWDFGDGSQSAQVSPSHVYSTAGTYTATLMVDDGTTSSAASTAAVTVSQPNQPPTVNIGGPYSGQVNVATVFDGSASSDPDGDPLTYSWDFGDGTQAGGSSPSHTYAGAGTYTVTLTVSDGLLTRSDVTHATITDIDSDGDGLTDSWELANGLDPFVDDAGADPDFDGFSNFEEFQNGTDPLAFDGTPDTNRLAYIGTRIDLMSFSQGYGFSDVKIDDQGFIYLAGGNIDQQSNTWNVARVNPDGSTAWWAPVGFTPIRIELDGQGFIYAASDTGDVAKVDSSNGAVVGTYTIPVDVQDIAVANNGLYIVGSFKGTVNFNMNGLDEFSVDNSGSFGDFASDSFITKLDSNLSYQWTRTYGSSNFDSTNSIIADASGDIYVSGGFRETVNFNRNASPVDPAATISTLYSNAGDLFVAKFTSNGSFAWVTQRRGAVTGVDLHGTVSSFDSDNNIRVSDFIRDTIHTFGTDGTYLQSYAPHAHVGSSYTFNNIASSSTIGVDIEAGFFDGTINFDIGGTDETHTAQGREDAFVRITDKDGYRTTIAIGGTSNDGQSDEVKYVHVSDNGILTIIGYFKDSADFDYGPGQDIYSESASGPSAFLSRYKIYSKDTDQDGIPDTWEIANGFDPNDGSDASLDVDGDGASNLVEFQNGSDPNDVNSCLGSECDVQINPPPNAHVEPIPAADAVSAAVGSTGGEFRVDESGSATYSIPIFSVPGHAGVEPEISLDYSSRSGNGFLGKGWTIGGLSKITRCKDTLAQDGQTKPVNLVSTKLCLDGQPLVLISGEYGKDGSTYRTDVDSYAEITVHSGSTQTTNPGYFTVKRKDGSLAHYDGLVTDPAWYGQRTLTWAITSFTDSTGANGIVYRYDIPGQPADTSLKEIAYGIDNRIEFTYEDRNDSIRNYVAGLEQTTAKRLSGVTVFKGTTAVRDYHLTYKPDSTLQTLSRLESVQECVGSTCLPKTTFSWSDPGIGFGQKTNIAFNGDSEERFITKPIDVNGDGKIDLLFTSTNHQSSGEIDHRLMYAMSDGTTLTVAGQAGAYNLPVVSPFAFHVLDYNNDGYQDVLRSNGSNWVVHLSDGAQLTATPVDTQVPSVNQESAIVVDFNGDGLPDILYDKGNAVYGVRYMEQVESAPGSGTLINRFSSQEFTYDFAALLAQIPLQSAEPGTNWSQSGYIDWQRTFGGFATPRVGDFDGDGRADILAVVDSNYWVQQLFLNDPEIVDIYRTLVIISVEQDGTLSISGQQAFDKYRWTSSLSHSPDEAFDPVTLDINNDGLTDIITKVVDGSIDNGNFITRVHLNKGTGEGDTAFFESQNLGSIPNAAFMYFTDYNHDGHLDMLYPPSWNADMYVHLWDSASNSFGAASATNLHFTGKIANIPRLKIADSYIFMDIDADSHDDAVHLEISVAAVNPEKAIYRSNSTGQAINVITGVNNGFGNQTTINYAPLTDAAVYTQEADAMNAAWPVSGADHTLGKRVPGSSNYLSTFDIKTPFYVVESVQSSAPSAASTPGNVSTGATSRVSYHYTGAKAQAGGRGLLGFHKVKSIDEQTGVETTTTYRQDYPFIGYPAETLVYAGPADGGVLLSRSTDTWQLQGWDGVSAAPPPPYRPIRQQSVEESYDINGGELLSTVTTTNSYDDAGNVLSITAQTVDHTLNQVFTTQTINQYGSSPYDKRFGRLSQSQVTYSRSGEADVVRLSAFTYYAGGPQQGLLHQEIVEPGSPDQLVTTHEYDAHGNKIKVTQTGASGANGSGPAQSRYQRFEYDANDQFPTRQFNTLEHLVEEVTARNALGQPTQVRNVNGVVTEIAYDVFGREYFRRDSTGAFTRTHYQSTHGSCPAGTQYAVTTSEGGGSQSLTCFDALGREIRAARPILDGTWIAVNTEYDSLGRVRHQSNPHPLGSTPNDWTTNHYDSLGRVTRIDHPQDPDHPSQSTTTYSYDNLVTTTANRKAQNTVERRNALGETISVSDNLQGSIAHAYDAAGNLRATTTSGNNRANGVPAAITIAMTYDALGRKRTMDDPDQGHWEYDYNAFGELVEQRDSKAQKIVTLYDSLGRISERQDIRQDGSIERHTNWAYVSDSRENGLGQVSVIADTQGEYSKTFSYDALGRAEATATSIKGESEFYEKVTYDAFGRVFQAFDAAGNYHIGNYTGIENEYGPYGHLIRIKDLDKRNGSQTEFYAVGAMDKWGNVTQELLDDGSYTTNRNYNPVTGLLEHIYTVDTLSTQLQDLEMDYDVLGNLTQRVDHVRNRTEDFGYDGLNRLTSTQVTGEALETISYDSFGNIKSKAGVGTYTYAESGAGAHAVTKTVNGGTTLTYTYDGNGNLTTDSSGRTLSYATYNKPTSVSKGGHSTAFLYDHDRSRYKRLDTDASGSTKTLYLGSVERITHPDGRVEIKRYVNGNTLLTMRYDSSGAYQATDTDHLFRDHLGSVNMIVKADASQVPLSFDAWGQRRSAFTWQALLEQDRLSFDHSTTTRGYTGHEMLDEVGLIHMNGRTYDPSLGRFMSADFLVQDTSFTQSYNRYSYVVNNPLTMSDPSGQIYQFALTAAAAYIGSKVATEFAGPYGAALVNIIGCASGSIASCTATTLGSTYATTGDFKASIQAAGVSWVSANAFDAVGSYYKAQAVGRGGTLSGTQTAGKLAAHATLGGIMNVLRGGKFGHGFVSTGITQAFAGPISRIRGESLAGARVAAAAIVGGTASELTGGKFANGAVTGAFSRLFNDELHGNASRKECITGGGGCRFDISENPNADGSAPWYELDSRSQVRKYDAIIDQVAAESGVDGGLIRSIMYIETTHGYYDAPLSFFGINKSILPMNINVSYWGETFGTRSQLSVPLNNIRAGANLLGRIQSNLPPGASIAQIGTLYNNLNATQVNNYGARASAVYGAQPWK